MKDAKQARSKRTASPESGAQKTKSPKGGKPTKTVARAGATAVDQPRHTEPPAASSPPPVSEVDDSEAALLAGGGRPLPPLPAKAQPLNVHLSHQLHVKLIRVALDEGVGLEALVQELLAEGVTLRAWEIIERKSAMRGGYPGAAPPQTGRPAYGNQNHPQGGGPGRSGGGGRTPPTGQYQSGGYGQGGGGGTRRPPAGGNAWMEDKAAFLEYVRNQERRRR